MLLLSVVSPSASRWLPNWRGFDAAAIRVACSRRDADYEITVAATRAELSAIGRLRYDLYVARDGKRYAADSTRQSFLEAIDDVSLNFTALTQGRLAAAVRLSRASDALHDEQLCRLLDAAPFHFLEQTVVNSRLAARPEREARALMPNLFCACYRAGLLAGATTCFLSTRSQLTKLFTRFGWFATGKQVADPVAGVLDVLQLNLHDIDRLRRVKSPLLIEAEQYFAARGGNSQQEAAYELS